MRFDNWAFSDLERASATTLSLPVIYTMSEMYSLMKDNCRCCLSDNLGLFELKAPTMGLWSVKTVVDIPSIKHFHFLTAANIASNSRSKVL